MTNPYREHTVRDHDDPPQLAYYDYATNLARDEALYSRRWPWFAASALAFFSAPAVLELVDGASFGEAFRTLLATVALVCGFVAFSAAMAPLMPTKTRRKERGYAAKKLEADTEAFLKQQEDADMKTRVFLRAATPGEPPEELATEPPPSEQKLTAA